MTFKISEASKTKQSHRGQNVYYKKNLRYQFHTDAIIIQSECFFTILESQSKCGQVFHQE